MATLLTADNTPVPSDEERAKEAELLEKALVIVQEMWLQTYLDGQLSLRNLLVRAEAALQKVHYIHRAKAIEGIVSRVVASPPPKRKRGYQGEPVAFRKAVAKMVSLVVTSEGLYRNRVPEFGMLTAYERACEIFKDLGCDYVSPRQAEEWYYKYHSIPD